MFELSIILLILNTCACVTSDNIIPSIHPIPKEFIHPQAPLPSHSYNYEEVKKPYEYEYAVKDEYSGTNFNVGEASDGKVVSGFYSILLPDGRRQNVKYTSDEYNGYIAEVSYEGEAIYPVPNPHKTHRPHYELQIPKQSEIVYNSVVHPKQPVSDLGTYKIRAPANRPVPVHKPQPIPVPAYNFKSENFRASLHTSRPAPVPAHGFKPVSTPVLGKFQAVSAAKNIPETTPFPIPKISATARADFTESSTIQPQDKHKKKSRYSFKFIKT